MSIRPPIGPSSGQPPAYDTPDEDVYLDGRNIILIAKAAVLCARRDVGRLVARAARGQPLPRRDQRVLRQPWPGRCRSGSRILSTSRRRFASMHKEDVIRLGLSLGVPLELHAVVHEAVERPSLRVVQQVPRAAGRVSHGGRRATRRVYALADTSAGRQYSSRHARVEQELARHAAAGRHAPSAAAEDARDRRVAACEAIRFVRRGTDEDARTQ